METPIERLVCYLQSDELTDEQRVVCRERGSFVVRACPGSGKTRTVGTRFAWRMANWESRRSGLAVLSFTNVASREIGRYLHDVLGFSSLPPHPHFLGTIDSFVNRFLLAPFGHVVMGCKRQPEVVHPQSPLHSFVENLQRRGMDDCMRNGCRPTSFSYTPEGRLEWRGDRKRPKCQSDRCVSMKEIMVRAGYALPTDAMYWGMKVACDVPGVASALARRFPEIIVDEAQDTTDVQFGILKCLWAAGSHVMMVGDPDQSIFEFSGGGPEKFLEFEEKSGKAFGLSANFRSSQNICNAAQAFSVVNGRIRASGPDRDYPVVPIAVKYGPQDSDRLMSWYGQLLDQQGISLDEAVVLCRTHRMLKWLSGASGLAWPRGVGRLTKALALAAALRDNRDMVHAHQSAMGALSQMVFSEVVSVRELRDQGLLRPWKRLAYDFLNRLPKTETSLTDWGIDCRRIAEDFLSEQGIQPGLNLSQNLRRVNDKSASAPVSAFVNMAIASNGGKFKVVHQAKGETYEAVMVVAGTGTRNRPDDLTQWLDMNGGSPEERRVAYVAVTRPKKLLVLAIPSSTAADITRRLSSWFEIVHALD